MTDTSLPERPNEEIIREWLGDWALNPTDDRDRRAAAIALQSIKFTKAGSFISPVAVAAIDILGIKSVLTRMSLAEVAEKFVEPFYDLNGPLYNAGRASLSEDEWKSLGFRRQAAIYSVTVSDTILLMRRPDWELGDRFIAEAEAVVAMAEYVCTVIKTNSLLGVPLRAAIAFGECLISVGENRALLGLPTGEASAWERQQEWIGGMLTPSAVTALRNGAEEAKTINGRDFRPQYPNTLTCYPIPLKEDTSELPQPQIALNWITGKVRGLVGFAKSSVPNEIDEDGLTPDIRRKQANTRTFAKHCEDAPWTSQIDF